MSLPILLEISRKPLVILKQNKIRRKIINITTYYSLIFEVSKVLNDGCNIKCWVYARAACSSNLKFPANDTKVGY